MDRFVGQSFWEIGGAAAGDGAELARRVAGQPLRERLAVFADDLDRRVRFEVSLDAPDTGSAEQPVHHAGYEYGVVIEGELTVEVDGVAYLLRPGDLISRTPPGRTGSGTTARCASGRFGPTWSAPDDAAGRSTPANPT